MPFCDRVYSKGERWCCDGLRLGGGELRFKMQDDSLESHVRTIVTNAAWLMLATLDDRGQPLASYLPFASINGGFGVAVSGLAEHTRALTHRPDAAVLFVDGDDSTGDAFARTRLSVNVTAKFLSVGSPEAATVWAALASAHGQTAETLQTLPDFSAVCLVPQRGRLILGFARAYDLKSADVLRVLKPAQ